MKYDYEKMDSNELCKVYLDTFGDFFAVNWDDNHENHRQEIRVICTIGR